MFVVSYVSNLSYVRERESKVVILVTIAGLWVHHGPYCSSRKVQQGWGGAGRGRGATRGGAGTEQLSWVSRVVSVVVSSLTWRRVRTRGGVFHASKDSPSKHTAKSWQKLLQKIEHT
jgi:hypothetical protein